MDWLTVRQCVPAGGEQLPGGWDPSPEAHTACRQGFTAAGAAEAGAGGACAAAGGVCAVAVDGFYRLSAAAVLGGVFLMLWLQRVLPRLEVLPLSAWRSQRSKGSTKALD